MLALIRRFKRPLIISSLLLFVAVIISLTPPGRAAESDAIAVRVLPNLEHDSIEVWYKKQGYQGSPQSLTVDGYEAIRDGRTVFVNAANVDGNKKIYTNVYLISYNQESQDQTQDILGQLISHWKFNSNIPQKGTCSIASLTCSKPDDCPNGFICANDPNQANYGKCVLSQPIECLIDSDCPLNSHCNSLKAGLIRDINRLGKLSQIEEKLEAYKKVEGSYPDLSEGSYLPGVTISVWPSWTDNFRELLGLNTLVVDPVNSLGSCPGFEPGTCWNPQTKRFFDSQLTLPSGSYAMIYRALPGGVSYNLCATFETPALGYDTANALLTSRNCASKGGYQGGVINQPPSLISSFLKGEANKEFNGYLKVGDPEGDIVSWRLAPAGNFSSWSAIPILEATGDPSQKKVYASSAGNQGTYPMILTLTDGRGAISTTPINLEIFDILKIAIEAEGISYNSFQSGSLRYNFFINSSDPRVNFQLSSPNATLNTGLTQAVAGAKITNVTSNRKQISLEIPLAQYLSGQYEVRISASDSSGADAKTVTFDFIRDPLTFNFSCDNQARLGKGYQIGGTSCLLGPLSQGVRTINYQVANNPFGFVVRNSGGNAFLEAYRVTSGNVSNPNAPTTTLLTLRASDNFGESTEKKLALRINTYCGDGIKQQPNTEAAGGPQNNGIEQCDGLDGLAPQGQISNSSNQQYACTTPLGVNTPFPINSNEHCAFKAPQDGGGYCGDGFCQVSSGGILRENCSNCPKDCGACECVPQCTGRECGDDGCGTNPNACGTCASGETCSNGICKAPVCVPNCTGKTCGTDGCGGTCGTCATDETCNAGLCEKNKCIPNCTGKTCGTDGCGGTCGTCASGETCSNGICKAPVCVPNCTGKTCGTDGCGGTCGTCATDETCNAGLCEENKCVPNCLGKTCGTDGCGGTCGTCVSGETCNNGLCEKIACIPNCSGRNCGTDGCGGTCGTCATDETCNAGLCEENKCIPNCTGKTCGTDGCGGTCGTCVSGETCNNGLCEKTSCIPSCSLKNCGDDGCGNSNGCGTCAAGETCSNGICKAPVCVPNCTGKTCGTDGCGGTCGTCLSSQKCENNKCITTCQPRCGINVCGDDGCGGSCGTCASGETCIYGLCCKKNATINVCGDRDTYVYFNGAYVNQSVEKSPLMTNTVSNVRTGYNYVQIKVYDHGPFIWAGNNFALSAGITYTGCRGKSGNIYYHSNTTDLYNWRCTNNYNSSWNSYNPSFDFYSIPKSVLSDAPHDTDSWCNKDSFYGPPSHQIWADTNKRRSNSETIYCYHRFNLESIVSSGKAKLPTYWCGDGTCNSGETYSNCSADCDKPTLPPHKPPVVEPCGDCQPGKVCTPCKGIE
ncbi:MAG: hypothetical protein ACOX6C_01860 [Patescibacteria group bacterium]|jgi:hypothetical protein